jgi:hypothetical protein
MKLFKFITGIILLALDFLIIWSFPYRYAADVVDTIYYLLALLGGVIYLMIHIVRKPENFYIWNHEFSHLLASKLFFKDVKGFHITSKGGGKVVVEKTNFLIDLAPYIFYPLVIITLSLAILFRRAGFQATTMAYFITTGYLLGMMFGFTAESFIRGQEDIKRNGYLFSVSVVLLFNFLILPFYLLPGVIGKKIFLKDFFILWLKNISINLRNIMETASEIYARILSR